jgi:two-component system chemotaxis sensor kinase CheA
VTPDDLAARLLATFRVELAELREEATVHLAALAATPGDAERLRALFRIVHTLKGAARAAGVPVVERRCHALEARLAAARDAARPLDDAALATLAAGLDALGRVVRALDAGRAPDDDTLDAPIDDDARAARVPTPPPVPPIDGRGGDGDVTEPSTRITGVHARVAAATPTGDAPAVATDGDLRAATVRIAAGRLDDLLGSVSRLLVVTARAAGHARVMSEFPDALGGATAPVAAPLRARLAAQAEEASAIGRELERLADEIGGGVRALRLRPVADAVEHLPALVRDVAATTGKRVRLVLEGTDLTADRAVLEQLREALLHLVRNAIDHGLESPEARVAAGKEAEGTIRIGARLEGDRLVLVVADDGRGLDVAALRERLAVLGETLPVDDRALVRRLFEGGVSTRAGVASAISGRGVGLDAAREALRRARGGLDVAWVAGEGTTFTLDAPLTLVTLRALLVQVGGHVAALPTAYVERLVRVREGERRVVDGRPAILTAEGPAVLAPLAAVLGAPFTTAPGAASPTATVRACVLRVGARRLAVAVDDFVGEHEVVVRPIVGRGRSPLPHVSGAALLADGRVALVLDAGALVATGLGLELPTSSLADAPQASAPRRARILVVDDSITTRTLEQGVLEAAGYEVAVAVDGADAWRQLQEHGADLVVSDVEMPRMDGFELCAAVRASPRLRELPVVLVTALESPEHRRRGLEVGADAYVGKSSFDQQALLDTVRRLLGEATPVADSESA